MLALCSACSQGTSVCLRLPAHSYPYPSFDVAAAASSVLATASSDALHSATCPAVYASCILAEAAAYALLHAAEASSLIVVPRYFVSASSRIEPNVSNDAIGGRPRDAAILPRFSRGSARASGEERSGTSSSIWRSAASARVSSRSAATNGSSTGMRAAAATPGMRCSAALARPFTIPSLPSSTSLSAAHVCCTIWRWALVNAAPGPAVRHGFPRSSSFFSAGLMSMTCSSAIRPATPIRLPARLRAVSVRFGAPTVSTTAMQPSVDSVPEGSGSHITARTASADASVNLLAPRLRASRLELRRSAAMMVDPTSSPRAQEKRESDVSVEFAPRALQSGATSRSSSVQQRSEATLRLGSLSNSEAGV
eukprot:scaffold5017_cov139-Isochrysis_galbana.AAC.6